MFSYPSVLTYVLGAQKNHLIETVLLSTHNICFSWEIWKIFFPYTLLTIALFFVGIFIFPRNYFRNTIIVSNKLDLDPARHFVGADLGPNCLPRLSADDKYLSLAGSVKPSEDKFKLSNNS